MRVVLAKVLHTIQLKGGLLANAVTGTRLILMPFSTLYPFKVVPSPTFDLCWHTVVSVVCDAWTARPAFIYTVVQYM